MSNYIRATPNDGETFKDVTKRLSLPYYTGSGYYQLIKSESISANKDLVLWMNNNKKNDDDDHDDDDDDDGDSNKPTWLAGGNTVRCELGLPTCKKINIKPSDLKNYSGGNCELFVQSTSPNRKLSGDNDVLFRSSEDLIIGSVTVSTTSDSSTTMTAATAAVAAAPAPAVPTPKKRKRRGNDNNNNNNNDDPHQQIVVWSSLIFPLTEQREELGEEDLVVGAVASNVPGDCDLPIPNNLVQHAIEMIHNEAMILPVAQWTETERTVVAVPDRWDTPQPSHVRIQWQSTSSSTTDVAVRLMYTQWEIGMFIALEIQGKQKQHNWGVVCGNIHSHPFVQTPQFMYANSDGSSSDCNLMLEHVNPITVLAKLIHDTLLHCSNVEH